MVDEKALEAAFRAADQARDDMFSEPARSQERWTHELVRRAIEAYEAAKTAERRSIGAPTLGAMQNQMVGIGQFGAGFGDPFGAAADPVCQTCGGDHVVLTNAGLRDTGPIDVIDCPHCHNKDGSPRMTNLFGRCPACNGTGKKDAQP
jgi:hypothetical protein